MYNTYTCIPISNGLSLSPLVLTDERHWSVVTVLDSSELATEGYRQKCQSLFQTKQWWQYQLIEQLTEKEMEQQRFIQSLRKDLQVYQQNKVSLQEALLVATQQGRYSNELLQTHNC